MFRSLLLAGALAAHVCAAPFQSYLGYGYDPLRLAPVFHVTHAGSKTNPARAHTGASYFSIGFDIPANSTNPGALAASHDFNSQRSNKDKSNFVVSTWGRSDKNGGDCYIILTVNYPGSSQPVATTMPEELTTTYQLFELSFTVPGATKLIANYMVQCGGRNTKRQLSTVFLDDTSVVETYV